MVKGFLIDKKEWSNEDKQILIDNFDSHTYKELSEILGRTESAVRHCANRIGLKKSNIHLNPNSIYSYDVDYFSNIDTEEKAYWLGFIMADGYVSVSKTTCELGIELSIKDINHLKKFNKCLRGNVQVKEFVKPEHILFSGRKIPETKMCSIRLYKKKIIEDIIKYGVVPKKTYVQKEPPIFNDELLNIAFLRGYFDADGSFTLNKKTKSGQFDITSVNLKILEYWRIYLYKKYKITSYISSCTNIDSTVPCYKLHFKGLNNSYIFGQLIYKDANIYLDRKYNKYNNYLIEHNVENRINNMPNGNYICSEIASLISND